MKIHWFTDNDVGIEENDFEKIPADVLHYRARERIFFDLEIFRNWMIDNSNRINTPEDQKELDKWIGILHAYIT